MLGSHKIEFINLSEELDNFFCRLCKFPLASGNDFRYNREYDCCHECFVRFAEPVRDKWKEGYRPDKTDVEEYIYKRKKLFTSETFEEQG